MIPNFVTDAAQHCLLIRSYLMTLNTWKRESVQHPELELVTRYQNLRQRIEEYKPAWDKDGVIQYNSFSFKTLLLNTKRDMDKYCSHCLIL